MKKELFDNFTGLISQIARQFYTWRFLQEKKGSNTGYNARGWFWGTFFTTFQDAFLLNISNIFDKDPRCLTIYKILDEISDENMKNEILRETEVENFQKSIKTLVQWRSNYLGHKNIHFTAGPGKLSEKFPLKFGEIEELLTLLIGIVRKNPREFNPKDATDYDRFYSELEANCIKDAQFVLENGLYSEKYKKLINKKRNE